MSGICYLGDNATVLVLFMFLFGLLPQDSMLSHGPACSISDVRMTCYMRHEATSRLYICTCKSSRGMRLVTEVSEGHIDHRDVRLARIRPFRKGHLEPAPGH